VRQGTPFLERLWARIEITDSCWLWTGQTTDKGYGSISEGRRSLVAHRVVYEQLVGVIPEGLQLDHLCRVTRCVNPDHLEAVTGRINTLRGIGPTAQNARKTQCPAGHAYASFGEIDARGYRCCSECKRKQWQSPKADQRRKAWRAAHAEEYRVRHREYMREWYRRNKQTLAKLKE
jgi:hypothetical protein